MKKQNPCVLIGSSGMMGIKHRPTTGACIPMITELGTGKLVPLKEFFTKPVHT